MAFELTSLNALADTGFDTMIDVRSPSEFAEDHVPGAINLPVLTDAERARVGTIYVQESAFLARKIGAALVARNAAAHIEGPLKVKDGGWRPLVYCWRGGQRSGSFASILSQIGWRVETLSGGYQSYRRLVVEGLYNAPFPAPVVLLDGNTGTAKTDVIQRLPGYGVQVLDLEGLAGHRGSALGGQGVQPRQKAFETKLAGMIGALDPSRPVVIEAESSKIGRLNLPPALFAAMKTARRLEVVAPVASRASYLCRAYGDLMADVPSLVERLQWLIRLQGRERVAEWVTLAEEGAFERLAEALIRNHYDPRYAKARARRGSEAEQVTADVLDIAGVERLAADVAARVGSSVPS